MAPSTMKAAMAVEKDGRGQLEVRDDVPVPTPGSREILVRVHASALNRADLLRVRAAASGGAPGVAGTEFAGEVEAVGPEVTLWRPGDRVMSNGGGGYAEYAAVDERLPMAVPDGMEWEAAGAAPVVYLTGHDAIVTNGRLQAGESCFVNAASSGAGLAALQIAKAKGAGVVIGATTSPGKAAALEENGASATLVTSEGDWAKQAHALAGDGVDVAVDHVGGSGAMDGLIRAAALKGRIIGVGRLGGARDDLDLDELARKRLRIIGVTFRTRTLEEKAAVTKAFVDDLWAGFADGRLKPVIHKVFPLDQAAEAQAAMRENAHVGKIVLKVT